VKNNNIKSWFSILEILIWIFIFSMWLTAVYSLLISTMKLNDYNKDYIIATYLAKWELDLMRNYRDSNYAKLQKYNQINTNNINYNNLFLTWTYYKIENNYSSSAPFDISLEKINDINNKEEYRLYLDSQNRYTYKSIGNTKTKFYKYIYLDNVIYKEAWVEKNIKDAIKIKAEIIWQHKGNHIFEVETILTDNKRL